jgi:hypothetical protein
VEIINQNLHKPRYTVYFGLHIQFTSNAPMIHHLIVADTLLIIEEKYHQLIFEINLGN